MSANEGAGELGLGEGSERIALRMNQLFLVMISRRGGGGSTGQVLLEDLGRGSETSLVGGAAVRDLYHCAVEVDDLMTGDTEVDCNGSPQSS
jgi:hypothetical protein